MSHSQERPSSTVNPLRLGPAEYRDLNEGLARLSAAAAIPFRIFVCECGEPGCAESLEAAISTYRSTRAVPNLYLVAPGHELNGPGTRVVKRNPRFSIVEERSPGGSAAESTNGDVADEARRVLIVDDDPAIRKLVSVNLQLVGLEPIEASDGLEGADRARVTRPDLVVTDLMMPGLSGFELAEALRRDERTRSIPIIFLSAQSQPEEVERARSLGALDFVSKPFDPVAFANRIKALFAPRLETVQG